MKMNFNQHLILASKSPRRQQLLRDAGFSFEVRTKDVDESFPSSMKATAVAQYLAHKKASAFEKEIKEKELLIAADTVVIVDDMILGKPSEAKAAHEMLRMMSGRSHKVMTGVTLASADQTQSFDDTTIVTFKDLTDQEINYYIEKFKPFDKAGAYGIQEWIGMVGITKIEGSYFNVVGLPIQKLYEQLKKLS